MGTSVSPYLVRCRGQEVLTQRLQSRAVRQFPLVYSTTG